MEAIKSRIRSAIQKKFGECPWDGATFEGSLEWDSMHEVEVELLLEREFGIHLDEGDIPGCSTVLTVVDLVNRKLEDGLTQDCSGTNGGGSSVEDSRRQDHP